MKKVMMYLLACSSMLLSNLTFAESPHEFSANVDLTTDYVYRGQSQSGNEPAISGGLDYAHSSGFYAGTWVSSIDFASNVTTEWDFYGGYSGEFSSFPVSYDLGVLYYHYPGTPSSARDNDFIEPYLGFGYDFNDMVSLGLTFRYSPDWQLEADDAFNVEGSVDVALSYGITLSGVVGDQSIDNNAAWGTSDWTYYSIGLSKALGPFEAGITWHDTDLSTSECGGSNICDGRVVFNIGSSW